jgi:hypothetical protein
MEKIEKILEIDHPSFHKLKDFFESFNFYNTNLPNLINNDFIYYDGVSPKGSEVVVDIKKTVIGSLNNKLLIENISECVDHIKSIYNVKMIWLMTYPPKTWLNFHRDHGKNRHVVSFNHNDRFFSYEGYSDNMMIGDTEMIINEKLKSLKDNIDEFNDYFLNYDSSCRISNLDPNCVYIFGNTIHNFINDSNQMRVNLVFEV